MRHFEHFPVGTTYELGATRLTSNDIIGYARVYDPMPFHLDPEAAARSPFGGLVASGWHTGAVVMGQFVRALLADAACQGSYGMDEVRFLKPVRPGDELRGRATVEEAAPHPRRPNTGTVRFLVEAVDQHGDPVYRMRTRLLFARAAAATVERDATAARR
ncbi:MaoC family dehydratase [Streptomyces sp. NBC_00525]|uniref:MaoC family dehydratase n=1 Tax=Streptomyces sp. NBC_00525 TaxID=2903660 RepID=UPI002E800559|nr:MaoC family dehydratase [Streptomyces sp. NBC_00525]WUC96870.1 MaoC family dehydratase [Streptomyces sp. NBC_00525]